jgi:hypothetical protein
MIVDRKTRTEERIVAKDLDWGDVYRDAENERLAAEAGTVLDGDDDVVCVECGEGDGSLDDDVVAQFWDGEEVQSAHYYCVEGRGWTLA